MEIFAVVFSMVSLILSVAFLATYSTSRTKSILTAFFVSILVFGFSVSSLSWMLSNCGNGSFTETILSKKYNNITFSEVKKIVIIRQKSKWWSISNNRIINVKIEDCK